MSCFVRLKSVLSISCVFWIIIHPKLGRLVYYYQTTDMWKSGSLSTRSMSQNLNAQRKCVYHDFWMPILLWPPPWYVDTSLAVGVSCEKPRLLFLRSRSCDFRNVHSLVPSIWYLLNCVPSLVSWCVVITGHELLSARFSTYHLNNGTIGMLVHHYEMKCHLQSVFLSLISRL